MITKRSEVYASYLFIGIQFKCELFILKTKKGEVLTSYFQKEISTLNMFSKNKQNKLRQTKNNEIKKVI